MAFSIGSMHSPVWHSSLGCQRTIHKLASTISNDLSEDWTPVELWLDLRGTAITPRMALSKLDEDSFLPASKVLVSIQDAQRAVQFSEVGDPDMLVVDESDDSFYDAKIPSIHYGIVVTLDGDSFVDPIPALETTTKGGWVLIDSVGGDEAYMKARHEAVSNLIDFISGGLSLGGDSFSLATATENVVVEGSTYNSEVGGIAVVCRTKADLIEAANALQSIGSGSLTTTESGILLKVEPSDSSSASAKESLRSAFVLPFDMSLWKAAMLVMAEVVA